MSERAWTETSVVTGRAVSRKRAGPTQGAISRSAVSTERASGGKELCRGKELFGQNELFRGQGLSGQTETRAVWADRDKGWLGRQSCFDTEQLSSTSWMAMA